MECPYCKHKYSDSEAEEMTGITDGHSPDGDEIECDECGESFKVYAEYSVHFYTEMVDAE